MTLQDSIPVPLLIFMRVCGALLVLVSIAELGVGSACYRYFTNFSVGGWWGALLSSCAGSCALASNSRNRIVAGAVLSAFAVVVATSASAVDAAWSNYIYTLLACVNSGTGTLYGNQASYTAAVYCAYLYPEYTCACSQTTNFLVPSSGVIYQPVCNYFSGQSDCGLILGTYPALLHASSSLCGLLAVLSFIYSVSACVVACQCVRGPGDDLPSGTTNPLNPESPVAATANASVVVIPVVSAAVVDSPTPIAAGTVLSANNRSQHGKEVAQGVVIDTTRSPV